MDSQPRKNACTLKKKLARIAKRAGLPTKAVVGAALKDFVGKVEREDPEELAFRLTPRHARGRPGFRVIDGGA